MKNLNFVALDFETANAYRRSACSIGMVKVEDGKIVDEYYSLIKPTPFRFEPINTKIHGLSEIDCLNAPDFNELWPAIYSWFENQNIVGHNVSFERSVLKHISLDCNIDFKIQGFICSLKISKEKLPEMDSYKLSKIYEYLFNKKLKHHHALEDARASAEIMITLLSDNGEISKLRKSGQIKAEITPIDLTPQLMETYQLLLEEKSIQEIAIIRALTVGTIINHFEKIVDKKGTACIQHIKPDDEIIMKVYEAITELEDNTLLKPIYEYLNESVSYDDIKISLLFLE
jgi:DNA polymerase-3 subunit epsilon